MATIREQVVEKLKGFRNMHSEKVFCTSSECADWELCVKITDEIICGKPDDYIGELADQILAPLTALGIEVD